MPINIGMKTYVITGCTSGLGYELTRQLLSAGHRVVPIIRRYTEFSGDVYPLVCDITEPNFSEMLYKHLANIGGVVDVVVMNAAPYANAFSLNELDREEMNSVFNTTVTSHAECFKACKPFLSDIAKVFGVSSRLGSISKNVGYEFSHLTRPPAYKIAKAALNMLMAIIKDENYRIPCAVVHPGFLNTKMGNAYGMDVTDAAELMIGFMKVFGSQDLKFVNLENGDKLTW